MALVASRYHSKVALVDNDVVEGLLVDEALRVGVEGACPRYLSANEHEGRRVALAYYLLLVGDPKRAQVVEHVGA